MDNILDEINKLREILNEKIENNLPFDELITVSQELDKLMIIYYKGLSNG